MPLSVLQHTKRSSKSKFSHDVEAEEVEPCGHINRCSQILVDVLLQFLCIDFDSFLVLSKSFGPNVS